MMGLYNALQIFDSFGRSSTSQIPIATYRMQPPEPLPLDAGYWQLYANLVIQPGPQCRGLSDQLSKGSRNTMALFSDQTRIYLHNGFINSVSWIAPDCFGNSFHDYWKLEVQFRFQTISSGEDAARLEEHWREERTHIEATDQALEELQVEEKLDWRKVGF